MKQILPIALCVTLAAAPVVAQDTDVNPEVDEGMSLMERGAKLFLRGLMDEVDPALEELKDFTETLQPNLKQLVERLGPVLNGIGELMDDATSYDAPERLPNGDIIIRRKPDAPELPDTGEVEL